MTEMLDSSQHIKVLHLTDSLDAGGAERVAVNLVNLLPRNGYEAHLCTTRSEGLLSSLVAKDVGRLSLKRKHRFDLCAIGRLVAYVRTHQIEILHAHSTSLFVARVASMCSPHPKVVWHDHYGRYKFEDRPVRLYRLAARGLGAVIAVNQPLVDWSMNLLRVPASQVLYIPNFVTGASDVQIEDRPSSECQQLPGQLGRRIVCVANFRPEKDHATLVQAMETVIEKVPTAHLLLVGAESDRAYVRQVRTLIESKKLGKHVSFLGQRDDVTTILEQCDVGVLSSASEGLPLALLEYGMAGLACASTDVGQCAEVLDNGKAGLLVPPNEPLLLGEALLSLLCASERRAIFGKRLHRRVLDFYGSNRAIQQICGLYESLVK